MTRPSLALPRQAGLVIMRDSIRREGVKYSMNEGMIGQHKMGRGGCRV